MPRPMKHVFAGDVYERDWIVRNVVKVIRAVYAECCVRIAAPVPFTRVHQMVVERQIIG